MTCNNEMNREEINILIKKIIAKLRIMFGFYPDNYYISFERVPGESNENYSIRKKMIKGEAYKKLLLDSLISGEDK